MTTLFASIGLLAVAFGVGGFGVGWFAGFNSAVRLWRKTVESARASLSAMTDDDDEPTEADS